MSFVSYEFCKIIQNICFTETASAQCSEYFGKFPGKLLQWSPMLSEKLFESSRPNILKGIFGEIGVSEEIAIENYTLKMLKI